jgi:tRNA (pseudouridine54-N1)-methyltransferase
MRCVRIPFPSDIDALPELPRRNFLVISHRARSDGRFQLDDLCGAAGRWDGLVRCVTAGLLVSHGVRKDAAVHLLLNGPPDPPRTLTVLGGEVRSLNPDERSTAALMRRALERPPPTPPSLLWAGYGIYVSRSSLTDLLDGWGMVPLLLDENGSDVFDAPELILPEGVDARTLFILSDDLDLSADENDALKARRVRRVSLSRTVLHSYQAIVACNLLLDRSAPAV